MEVRTMRTFSDGENSQFDRLHGDEDEIAFTRAEGKRQHDEREASMARGPSMAAQIAADARLARRGLSIWRFAR
jgi:hypothetical protein